MNIRNFIRKASLRKKELDEIILKIKSGFVLLSTKEAVLRLANEIKDNFKSLFFDRANSRRTTVSKDEFDLFWGQLKEEYVRLGGKESDFPLSPSGEMWSFGREEDKE